MPDPEETARLVSDRHFGVGSDGLILICPSKAADFEMRMYNADGSRGEMCGNGIRCVGKYVYDYGLTEKTDITVETLAGIKYLEIFPQDGKAQEIKVDMGAPVVSAIDSPIEVNGQEYRITEVSMGNPHAVLYIEDVQGLAIDGPADGGDAGVGARLRGDPGLRHRRLRRGGGVHGERADGTSGDGAPAGRRP